MEGVDGLPNMILTQEFSLEREGVGRGMESERGMEGEGWEERNDA